jgi:hypothetical protein
MTCPSSTESCLVPVISTRTRSSVLCVVAVADPGLRQEGLNKEDVDLQLRFNDDLMLMLQ